MPLCRDFRRGIHIQVRTILGLETCSRTFTGDRGDDKFVSYKIDASRYTGCPHGIDRICPFDVEDGPVAGKVDDSVVGVPGVALDVDTVGDVCCAIDVDRCVPCKICR